MKHPYVVLALLLGLTQAWGQFGVKQVGRLRHVRNPIVPFLWHLKVGDS